MKGSVFYFVLCLFYLSCTKPAIVKCRIIEKQIKNECKLDKNEGYKYCFVLIQNKGENNGDWLEMTIVFCNSIMVLEKDPNIYQSEYYQLYGKLVSVCVPVRIKDKVLVTNINQFDYDAHLNFSSREQYYTPHVSSRFHIDKNTWQITKIIGNYE